MAANCHHLAKYCGLSCPECASERYRLAAFERPGVLDELANRNDELAELARERQFEGR